MNALQCRMCYDPEGLSGVDVRKYRHVNRKKESKISLRMARKMARKRC